MNHDPTPYQTTLTRRKLLLGGAASAAPRLLSGCIGGSPTPTGRERQRGDHLDYR